MRKLPCAAGIILVAASSSLIAQTTLTTTNIGFGQDGQTHSFKIASLNNNNAGSSDRLHLIASLNAGDGSTSNTYLDAVFARRGAFSASYTMRGANANPAVKLVAYEASPGNVDIYFVLTNGYNSVTYTVLEQFQETVYANPTDTNGVLPDPSLLIFDSSNPAYPPTMYMDFWGHTGIGTGSPQAPFHIVSPHVVTATSNSPFGNANLVIEGTDTIRSTNNGAALSFALPTSTNGTGPWEHGRIIVTPDDNNNASAFGHMYLQTRYNNNGVWDWRNNLSLFSDGSVALGAALKFPDGTTQTTAINLPQNAITLSNGNTSINNSLFVVGNSQVNAEAAQGTYLTWNTAGFTGGETDFINNRGAGPGGFAFFNTVGGATSRQLLMFLDGYAHLGLGTAAPQKQFSVAGNANLDQGGSNHGAEDGSSYDLSFGDQSGEAIGSARVDGSPNRFGLDFYTGGHRRVSITNGGFVGINTPNPQNALYVNGDIGFSGGLKFSDGSTQTTAYPGVNGNGVATLLPNSAGAGFQLSPGTQTIAGAISSSGNLTLQGNPVTDTSATGGFVMLGGSQRGDALASKVWISGNTTPGTYNNTAGILVDGSNNVGIGMNPTATPAGALDVGPASPSAAGGLIVYPSNLDQNVGQQVTNVLAAANSTGKLLIGTNRSQGGQETDLIAGSFPTAGESSLSFYNMSQSTGTNTKLLMNLSSNGLSLPSNGEYIQFPDGSKQYKAATTSALTDGSVSTNSSLFVPGNSTFNPQASQGSYLTWNWMNGAFGETDLVNNRGTAGAGGGFAFYNTDANSSRNLMMFLNGGGQLGIGTSSPVAALTLAGTGDPNRNPNSGGTVDYPGESLAFQNHGNSDFQLGRIRMVQPNGYYLDRGDMVFSIGANAALDALSIQQNGNIKIMSGALVFPDGSSQMSAGGGINLPAGTISQTNGNVAINAPLYVGGGAVNGNNQGAYMTWNTVNGGSGQTEFINSRGLGGGGFGFFNTVAGQATPATLMQIDGGGTLTVAGNIHLANSAASIVFPDGGQQTHAWMGWTPPGQDYADSVDVTGGRAAYEPGDVLMIDPKNPRTFIKGAEPYSTLIGGVYSTKPGIVGQRESTKTSTTEVPLALTGIVPTKVSCENGPVHIGDLLVSSSTPGYAMRGTDRDRLTGAVLGKALGSVDKGFGIIEVLVALQ